MWTTLSTLGPRLARCASRGFMVLLLGLVCSACSPPAPPPRLLSTRCLAVDGQHEASLRVVAPEAGLLRVGIEERGLSVVATLDEDPGSATASPVERLGTLVLVSRTGAGQEHTVRIQAHDSPHIRGEACASAELIPESDLEYAAAEEAFAKAGRQTQQLDWQGAFDGYLTAARKLDRLGLRRRAAASRHAMAELAYRRFDRKRDAYALAGEALAGYGSDVDPIFVGLLTGLRASALLGMPGSEPREVAPTVTDFLERARRLDESSRFGARELPRLDIMTGYLHYTLDAPARAAASFGRAAQRCRELEDWDCYAVASQNLALLAESTSYATALAAYADALRLLPPGLDPRLRADIRNNLGRLQGVVGLFTASEHSHEAAMREYAQLGDCPGARRSMSRLGTLMSQLGVVGDAEAYLQRAASLDCSQLLATVSALAGGGADSPAAPAAPALGGARSPAAASASRDRAGLCAGSLDPGTLATENKIVVFNSLLTLGNVLVMEGELPRAGRCYETARPYAADSRTQVRLANANGALLLERSDAAGAHAAFAQALRIADAARLSATYEHRGAAQLGMLRAELLAGDTSGTLQHSYRALQSSVARGDIDQTVSSLRLIAATYRQSRHETEAAQTLLTAVDLIEAVPIDGLDGEKRATYLATQYGVFAELTDLLTAQAEADPERAWPAFTMAERGRARSLRYAVSQAARAAASSVRAVPAARYQQMLRQVAQAAETRSAAPDKALVEELDQAAIRERGTAESADGERNSGEPLDRERGPAELLDRERLTRTLGELDATLVEYAAGSRTMFAFVVGGGNVRIVRLASRLQIAAAAAELRRLLRDPESPPAEVRSAAAQLARLVLWPLTGYLSGKHVIFAPEDALHTIPFSVLPWSSSAADHLLLQHTEVSLVPSALFLTESREVLTRSAAPRVELIGDPVFRVTDWRRDCEAPQALQAQAGAERTAFDWTEMLPALPGSRAEVLTIARLAQQSRPSARVETILGCAAVPSALRRAAAGGIDLLHVATHARVDAQRPRLSALAFTPENGYAGAGAFGLLDILGLKLNSRLVVLSACDTSRGRLLAGEGVLGPAQAFLQAGAAAVIASYWRVGDQATADFMQEFYRHLLVERLPAARALRQAQLDRAADSTSYDWSAFALYGWPDSGI